MAADDPSAAERVPDRSVTVTPRHNGPLVVEGQVSLVGPDGSSEVVERLFLCRCGASADKPRCDGSHKRIGFDGPGIAPTRKPE